MSFSGDGSIVCVESCGAGGFGAIINVILPPACALSASASVCDTVVFLYFFRLMGFLLVFTP